MNDLCGPDTVLVCDASFASGWGGVYFEAGKNRRAIFPRGMAGLGWALPAAIGAKMAQPDHRIVVLAGDGAMTYCLGELATLGQQGLNVTVVVLNNSAMGWIKWEQAVSWGSRFQSTDLSDVDFAMAARAMGCSGVRVKEPSELRDALAQALTAEEPSVVDVETAVGEAALSKFAEAARKNELILESLRDKPKKACEV
jgi:acetolactate synthase-1/2/3 large subunit